MDNNQMITIQVDSSVSYVIDQLNKLAQATVDLYKTTTTTIAKISSSYSNLGKTSTNLKNIVETLDLIKLSFEDSTSNGITGLNKLNEALKVVTKGTNLEYLATLALNTVLTPKGLGLIAAGVTGIATAFIVLNQKQNAIIEKTKEEEQALREQKAAWDQMSEASKEAMDLSLIQVELTQKYADKLLQMTDANGQLIGSQEEINFLIEQLNKMLPEAGFQFDEESGKILNLNGEVVNLTDSLEDLINVQKAQAYLDAYKDDYSEALKGRNQLMKEQLELIEQIDNNKAVLEGYHDAVDGLYGEERIAASKEYLDSVGMTIDDLINMDAIQEELWKKYQLGNEQLKAYTETMSNYESMQEAIINKDWDKVNHIMNDLSDFKMFTPEDKEEQVQILQEQLDDLERMQGIVKEMNANKLIDASYLDYINEQVDKAQAEFEKAREEYKIDTIENSKETAEASGAKFTEIINLEAEQLGQDMISKASEDASKGIDAINEEIKRKPISSIYVPVEFVVTNDIPAIGSRFYGASYDDSTGSTGSIFPAFTSGSASFMSKARMTLGNVQSRITKGLSVIPSLETKIINSEGKQVELNQTNIFNVPVEKPSAVSRAIEKQNRELAKRL